MVRKTGRFAEVPDECGQVRDSRVGFPRLNHPFSRVPAVKTDVDIPLLFPYACASLRFTNRADALLWLVLPLRSLAATMLVYGELAQTTVCAFPHCFAMRKIAPIRLRAKASTASHPTAVKTYVVFLGFRSNICEATLCEGRYADQAVGRAKRQSGALARVGRPSSLQ